MFAHRTGSDESRRRPPVFRSGASHRRVPMRALALVAMLALLAACSAEMDDESGDSSADDLSEGGFSGERAGDGPVSGDLYLNDDDALEGAPSPPDGAFGVSEAEAGEPRAGSVDDNQLWDDYLAYRGELLAAGLVASPIEVGGRRLITVVDADGDPVLGASITILDAAGAEIDRLSTYADGRAVFLPATAVDPNQAPAYTARVTKGQVTTEVALDAGVPSQSITLDADIPSSPHVDVLFLIDTTGSMSDEIDRLKSSMITVSEQLSGLPSAPDVRFAMVLYRDRGDEYITRTFDFTGDIAAFTSALSGVVADGGGDTPESLATGLQDAVTGPTWRGDDTVKLVFLLSDAPPHLPTDPGYADEPDYAAAVRAAAAAGVKVFPIASSGLDDQGEFVFRQVAQATMGRFVFLTYGVDGRSPGDTTSHHVDPEDYDVLALDELVVQLVTDELAHLG
jgi:hypothetical protein